MLIISPFELFELCRPALVLNENLDRIGVSVRQKYV